MTVIIPRHGRPGPDDEGFARALTEETIEEISSIEQSPHMLDAMWNSVRTCVGARSTVDPACSGIETWEAVVNAMQVGSAIFRAATATGDTFECRIHHEMRTLPVTGPRVYANAPSWIDAFYFALICRDQERLTELCEVPMAVLRDSGAQHDEYLYHWVATLQAYWSRQQPAMVEALTAAFRTSDPDMTEIAPRDWLQTISYPPINLFYRFVKHDHAGFNDALTEALELHKRYWTKDEDREKSTKGLWAIGPLAMACLAYDGDFPVDVESEYLPQHLLQRSWVGEFPI
ncbi:immunity 49 family protein [Streptomyces sp. NBC_00525]|uniref:immunity 49 family protein n=1 Tax=Streptomyces sp. NBC_00525 TaxID=2903660 RepID=UPI002E80DA84|nr:immunity 49 family protein [Streptomyces sp. NBC_00525]WUC93741.1 immunity 49 family protein [Streptomyces sp. NBC_00525]